MKRLLAPQSRLAPWLFPITYFIHLIEEFAAPEWFGAWSERVLGMPVTVQTFLVWNGLGLVTMCVCAAVTLAGPGLRWLEIAMALAVLGNAFAHVVLSAMTFTFSPGLITSLLLWIPLGLVRLPIAFRESPVWGRWLGVAAGVAVTAIVVVVVASGAR